MPRRTQRQRERSDSDSDPNPQPARRVKFRNNPQVQVQETSSPRSSPPPIPDSRPQAKEEELVKNDPKVSWRILKPISSSKTGTSALCALCESIFGGVL
jgi:hypothetical protein